MGINYGVKVEGRWLGVGDKGFDIHRYSCILIEILYVFASARS
jgi:hypothetical protein